MSPSQQFRVRLDITGPGFAGGLTGPEFTGPEFTGPEFTGPEFTGPEFTGPEFTGPEFTGPEFTGPEFTGPGSSSGLHVSLDISGGGFGGGLTGPEFTGPEFTGPEFTGPEFTGPEFTGPEFTGGKAAAAAPYRVRLDISGGPSGAAATGPEFTGPEFTGVVDGLGPGGRHLDRPDKRDHLSGHNTGNGSADLVDLREGWTPVVYDQGRLPACTSNAVAAAIDYLAHLEPSVDAASPSRMYLYWNERYGSGGTGDVGVSLRTALKSLAAYGSAPAELWPYKQQTLNHNPPREAYQRSQFSGGVTYERLQIAKSGNPEEAVLPLLRSLADKRPILFGLSVYDNFRHVPSDGIIPMPTIGTRMLFGHAGLIVGARKVGGELYFVCQNSWGADWADKGFYYLSAAYVADRRLAQDFWAITQLAG